MIWTRINVPGCDLNVPEASKQRLDVLDGENFEGDGCVVDEKFKKIKLHAADKAFLSIVPTHPSRTATRIQKGFAYRERFRGNRRYFTSSPHVFAFGRPGENFPGGHPSWIAVT
ncbi:hypothetical protein E3N88_38950 [Mikania micrantha]|uniref:Uncharacterized protein n=1 Tax=Mikania micrantha TaxID=192012 RepID=A0A5N6LVD6_9ASTR|nr:hypothetical protein E3N88_38950 [Mikania micrantha]